MRLTFKYKINIFFSFFCALALALCWGGNIAAVYPLVQISFQGQTVSEWYEIKVEEKGTKLLQLDRQIKELDTIPADTESVKIMNKNRQKSLILQKEDIEKELAWYHWSKPYIDKYAPGDPFLTVVWLMVIVLITTYIKSILGFFQGLLAGRLGMLGTMELRNTFFKRLLSFEVNHYSQQGVSDTISRFTNDIGSMSGGLSLFYGKLVREPLKMLVCVIGALMVSWQLFLFTGIFTPLVAFMISWMAKALRRVVRNSMVEMVSMYSQISETFRSIRIVKAFNREDRECDRFQKTNNACYQRGMKIAKYGSLTSPLTECMGMTMMIFAVMVGAWLVIYQKTTIFGIPMSSQPLDLGALILFYGFLIGAADPARRLSDFFVQIQGAIAAADRVYQLVDRNVQLVDPEHPREIGPFTDKIVLNNIYYSYPQYENLNIIQEKNNFFASWKRKKSPQEPQTHEEQGGDSRIILKGISLEFKFGETVAIVGPSGCGKSTLLNLIPRFYDPTEGTITFDSIPYKEIRMHDIREQIGLVTQEPVLFNDTVLENIRYGAPDASREEVIEAAKMAYAHDFIMEELANGYDTNVGPGGGCLSGGQRQRIALARAFLKNPRIFLLDEATSQIDIRSEQYIHDALAHFVGNRTTIIVTHRLTAVRLADRIIVMQDGLIEHIGTHQELMESSPFYAGLWHSEGMLLDKESQKQ